MLIGPLLRHINEQLKPYFYKGGNKLKPLLYHYGDHFNNIVIKIQIKKDICSHQLGLAV